MAKKHSILQVGKIHKLFFLFRIDPILAIIMSLSSISYGLDICG